MPIQIIGTTFLIMISKITHPHTYLLSSQHTQYAGKGFNAFSETNQFCAIKAITMAILCLYQYQMVFLTILLIYIFKISLE